MRSISPERVQSARRAIFDTITCAELTHEQKVSAYSGWEYEYVEGSWYDLMQKLMER